MTQLLERKGFTFFRSYYESTMKLPDKQRLAIYDAIVKYSFEGDIITFDGAEDEIVKAILFLIKPTLDISIKKSNAGARGGRSNCQSRINRKANKNESNNNQERSKTEAQGKQSVSNQEASSGDIDNDQNFINVSRNTQHAEYGGNGMKQKGFDEFWDIYPRKVGQAAAKKIWSRINPDEKLQINILTAIKQQKKSSQWQRDNGQFIPNPSTWLNQCRWDDELPESVSNTNFSDYSQRDYPDGFYEKFVSTEFGINKNTPVSGQ